MRLTEAKFRRILREEARRVLTEEAVTGITVAGIASAASAKAQQYAKKQVVGRVTGLGTVASPVAIEGGALTFTGAAVAPYLIAAYGVSTIVELIDETLKTLDAAHEAADRNTKTAISNAKTAMFTMGLNSGKQQGLIGAAQAAEYGKSYNKLSLKQPLTPQDQINVGVVYSMLTSADVDKAFNDSKQSFITKDSGKYEKTPGSLIGTFPAQRAVTRAVFGDGVDEEAYNKMIEDFKSKLGALQKAALEQVAKLKADQFIKQAYADIAKTKQTPEWQAQEQQRLAALRRDADAAEFARGKVPDSYKPIKR